MRSWCMVLVVSLLSGAGGKQLDSEDGSTILTNQNINSPDDVKQIVDFKETCRKNVGEDAVEAIEKSQQDLLPCFSSIIDMDKLRHEINRSIPRGELDLVFKKYCGRRESLMACVEDMFTSLERCMNDQERKDLQIARKAIDAGIDFVCHKDGDRIALFMAEKGEECLVSQKDNIKECVEEKIPEVKEAEQDINFISPETFTINEANCKKLNAMHQCVVKHTEKCEDPTPANILDSLIIQVLKVTPCWQTSGAETVASQSQYILSDTLTLIAAALTAANILL
ncbi:27 kDa glycoprotein-like [Penaeus japonicus]|uniref:27 kDa glycoprotein-like n=1 Tax=Penaeus japonicus TaxID=27405 RepID=UPI001C7171CC|nr:27 kDa glycoprotein-like [Penaeus japonicus]